MSNTGPKSYAEAVNTAKAGQVQDTRNWNANARATFRANGGKG